MGWRGDSVPKRATPTRNVSDMNFTEKTNIGAIVWRGLQIFLGASYVGGLFIALFVAYKAGWIAELGSIGLDYKDFISILLTAIALMLAVLGAILAVLAVYGFQGIKQDAMKRAERAAKKSAKSVATAVAKETAQTVAEEVAAIAITTSLAQVTPASKEVDSGETAGQDKDGDSSAKS